MSLPASRNVYDAVVVGAGPYGLSAGAHLLGRGLKTAVFGRPLELWRKHMPDGMRLRSHWWASNLSDPGRRYGFERFFGESGHGKGYPVPRQAFLEYGRWFQEQAVPEVEETYVDAVERENGHFRLTLQDGREVRSAAVVMAVGLCYYAHRPEAYASMPAGLVSHSCDLDDCTRFRGRQVVVVGGGQSAVEYAALLHEAGARVHLVSRRPVQWLDRDRADERSALERIRAPRASIGPGWINWTLDHAPYLFQRLPADVKRRALRTYYAATAAHWLRDRVVGKATLHEGHTIVRADAGSGGAELMLSDGERVRADHVILATGYKVDLGRLRMLAPSLRTGIVTDGAAPTLNPWFESSVRGLYFVGMTSLPSFGPLFRFVAGCGAAARRVAARVASCRASRPR
jgi:cation diffusion facilitator CzcD-associated flavoprotein CzcO